LQRELDERLSGEEARDQPAWAAAQLALPGMYDEYAALRGLDDAGRVGAAARDLLGTEELLDLGLGALAVHVAEAPDRALPARAPGEVLLRGYGSLSAVVGGERRFACDLPTRASELLSKLASELPSSAELLTRAAVHRDGQRLAPHAQVAAGDVLDLVLAISGG
jgi:sulfur carrier protein ThiS